MARAHLVKKARKAIPSAGIKKGDAYYWWQFYKSPKSYSKQRPRRSQLTRSGFKQGLYDLQDNLADEPPSAEDMDSERDSLKDELESLKSDCENSLEAMPDHLRDTSDSGQTLQARIDSLDEQISELEGIDCDFDADNREEGQDPDEYKDQWRNETWEEIKNCVNNVEEG